MISQVAENWRLDRMAAIDRNILRLGAYEMLFCPEVPAKVAINEALELAKRYSTAQSSRFVNGILDRVLQWQIAGAEVHSRAGGRARTPGATRPSRHHRRPSRRRMKPNPRKAAAATAPSRHRHVVDGAADLHVHTTHSDGVCSPCEVVVAAARVGLAALAITDHDTVSALAVARPEAARWGIELIAGVELTCEHDGRELHILGHFIRDDDPALLEAMASLRAGRTERLEAMAARLRDAGPLDRSGGRPARLPPRGAGPAPPGRLPGADRPGGQPARGLRPLPRRWLPGLRGQTSARLPAQAIDLDPRGRRRCRTGPSPHDLRESQLCGRSSSQGLQADRGRRARASRTA